MIPASLAGVLYDLTRRDLGLNSSSDPRVGSSRDNATSTSPLKVTTNSASITTLFVTFVPVLVYAVICLVIFLTLRRKYPRVYSPRTYLSSLSSWERSPELPSGWFKWMKVFYQTPDTVVLNHSSLDGFLFLRYLKILCVICSVGCILTWPILIPYHVYGGGTNIQLDLLTFGNVVHSSRFFLHAFLAWVYFGFILYMISRECVYFISLRQAYLISPLYANHLSSRTVLFTCVPQQILDERKLRRVFGDKVKNIWIPRATTELDELVKERDQTASRLEKAEIQLIKKANEAYRKALKNGHPDLQTAPETPGSRLSKESAVNLAQEISSPPKSPTLNKGPSPPQSPSSPQEFVRSDGTPIMKTNYGFDGPPPDINGSIAAQWIPYSQRPVHRPIANYGRRVDTIKWTRSRLKKLAPEIAKLRNNYRKSRGRPIPAVFIEFQTQLDAQTAYQTLAHHRANHMRPEIVGVRPHEIIWPSLRFTWWERVVRRFLTQGFIALMVVFWSFPAVLVGAVSNIKFLTNTIFFLSWINLLPSVILGLISGLLPSVALAALMAIVPAMLRVCARQAGVATEAKVELFVQSAYFPFQVVQVFLVTTITSAASAAITGVIKDPLSAREVLSQNLPKASNFYISYFILQGFAMSATRTTHIINLFRFGLASQTGLNPKLRSTRYHRLRRIHWGAVYPVFTNMGVIAISYSLIAPIILGVAAIGLFTVYLSYRYNLLYVYSCERDTRGLHYPRALSQTLTGVYLAEICLVGLFGLQGAYGPLIMTFGLVIFTALVHISLSDALDPLIYNLPRTVAAEEELRLAGNNIVDASNLEDKNDALEAHNAELQQEHGYDSDFDPSDQTDLAVDHGEQNSRGVEGADRAAKVTTTTVTSFARKKLSASPIPSLISKINFWTYWITPDPTIKPNFVLKFLHPEVFSDYHILRKQIPEDIYEATYEESLLRDAYSPPSMRNRSPRLWIPQDAAGISKQEVAHSGKVIEITDQDAWLNDKGVIDVDLDGGVSKWVARDGEKVKF